MSQRSSWHFLRSAPTPLLLSTLIVLALLGIGWYAPTESTMGQVQRIVYIHFAVAWFRLWGLNEPDDVASNLTSQGVQPRGGSTEVVYISGDQRLPAQYQIYCELGRLPVPWTTYAKWAAGITLGLFALLAILLGRRHAKATDCARAAAGSASDSLPDASHTTTRPSRKQRRRHAA